MIEYTYGNVKKPGNSGGVLYLLSKVFFEESKISTELKLNVKFNLILISD